MKWQINYIFKEAFLIEVTARINRILTSGKKAFNQMLPSSMSMLPSQHYKVFPAAPDFSKQSNLKCTSSKWQMMRISINLQNAWQFWGRKVPPPNRWVVSVLPMIQVSGTMGNKRPAANKVNNTKSRKTGKNVCWSGRSNNHAWEEAPAHSPVTTYV